MRSCMWYVGELSMCFWVILEAFYSYPLRTGEGTWIRRVGRARCWWCYRECEVPCTRVFGLVGDSVVTVYHSLEMVLQPPTILWRCCCSGLPFSGDTVASVYHSPEMLMPFTIIQRCDKKYGDVFLPPAYYFCPCSLYTAFFFMYLM